MKDNFLYHKNKTLPNENTHWECSKRRSGGGCKVKVLLDEHDQFLVQSGEHTHPLIQNVEKARAGMKMSAKESNATTDNIFGQNIAGRSQSVLVKLPKMETMRRDVRRKRAAHSLFKDMSCINLCFSIEMFSVMKFGIWLIFMLNKDFYIPLCI